MKRATANLPINLVLYKNIHDYVTGFSRAFGKPVRIKTIKEMYRDTVSDAETEEDIQEIVKYRRRMGWLPKDPHRKKQAR